MTDIEIDTDKLSIPARQTIKLIDTYIDTMSDRSSILKAGELQLFIDRWEELDGSISYQSGREYNLTEYTYRGVRITKWDGDPYTTTREESEFPSLDRE